jgi:hypothetical protein
MGIRQTPMSSSQEYRQFAARCLEIERHAHDAQTQAQMLQMAQICHRLADEMDLAQREHRRRHQSGPAGPRHSR